MPNRPSIENFDKLVREPLARTDPFSFKRVERVLKNMRAPHAAPFSYLIRRLVGKRLSPQEGLSHWSAIIDLKRDMESRLGRSIDIQTAAVEHFAMLERDTASAPDTAARVPEPRLLSTPVHDPESPEYHLQRLKDEMMRARRYSHALSAIMVELRGGPDGLDGRGGEKTLRAVARIIERTIRAVDILTRSGPRRFLVILPDTNRREAQELAERIRATVDERTQRMGKPASTAIAAGQCEADASAQEFVRVLQSGLTAGGSALEGVVPCGDAAR
jgi:diguanylate cyclase (GGDEF)-like protein